MSRTLALSASSPQLSALPAGFECSLVTGDPDAVCVHAAGELDIATTPSLELALRDALLEARLVVLDLRDLAFIDSTGIHAIVNATIRAREGTRRLVILRGPANVDRAFKLTRTLGQLEFVHADSLGPVCAEASRRRRSGSTPRSPPLRALSR
jgi:anti-anti-sigma factor